LDFYECRIEDLLEQEPIKDQKFDLIINVEGRSRFGTETFKVLFLQERKEFINGII